jgi:hypothetical protein
MRHLTPRRLASLALSLAILAIPAIVTVLTAAPRGCSGGCT